MKDKCTLCPRNCSVDRENGKTGYCGQTDKVYVARAALHMWEEPCISGKEGSGTVFFCGCTLRCIFCQNHQIALGKVQSGDEIGKEISMERLKEIFLELQEIGANNINLVTGTHYIPQIARALKLAKEEGLRIPIVYNTSGYEKPESLHMLDGLVDIYLPDMKYADSALAKTLSGAADYFPIAAEAIKAMVRQVGAPQWDGEKLKKGVVIRHLILPGQVENSLKVLDWIGQTFAPGQVLVSLMRQYTPMPGLTAPLDRKITEDEYQAVLSWMYLNDLEGFTQEADAADTTFIPDF